MIRAVFDHVVAFHRAISRCAQGSVALIGALSVIALVGMGAFAVEASAGYSAKVSNQRIADMAALGGALAYNVANDQTAMTATAKAIVVAQGGTAGSAAVALVTDPAPSKQLVQVTITTTVPLSLGRVLTTATGYDVISVGMATVNTPSAAPPCIAALSSSITNGVDLSGGTSISAPGCAINTNAGVNVPNGTSITAKQVNAGKTVTNPGNAITTSPTANQINQNKANAASDWASGNSALKAALCQVNRLTGTSDPDYADGNTNCASPMTATTAIATVGASDWTLNYSPAANVAAYRTGNATYVIPAGTYTIGTLTLAGGITATFQGPSTIKMNAVSMGGTALTFGDGTVSVSGALSLSGGVTVTIGNGAHGFGSVTVGGGSKLNVGSGNVNIVAGLNVSGGGSTVNFANATGDSIVIGPASGDAINLSGGSVLSFVPSGSSPLTSVFSANGRVVTAGGSTLTFPNTLTHVINGDLNLNGGSTFGSGSYIIAGNFTNNTGGTMSGVDVTFALGGTFTLSGGTSLDLAAPASTSSYGVPDVLIATKSSAATTIGGGSSDKYAGLFYAPKSALQLSGGAAVSANSSACLMLIVNNIVISGGGTFSTGSCTGVTGSSGTTASVALFK